MIAPRWAHHLYARTLGYFWLPCPVCGREFGGHEWDGRCWRWSPRLGAELGSGFTTSSLSNLSTGYRESWIGEGCCDRHQGVPDPITGGVRVRP